VAQNVGDGLLRHAHAQEFVVSLRCDGDWLALAVQDDGVGFDPAARLKSAERYKDLGLLGMEERVALVGGRLQIRSAAGTGTTVGAWFPLKWRESAPEFE
jgi:signal transduction histidine kinase